MSSALESGMQSFANAKDILAKEQSLLASERDKIMLSARLLAWTLRYSKSGSAIARHSSVDLLQRVRPRDDSDSASFLR